MQGVTRDESNMAQQSETPSKNKDTGASSSAEESGTKRANGHNFTPVTGTNIEESERDEFGLPIRRHAIPVPVVEDKQEQDVGQGGKVATIVKKINQKSKEEEEEARQALRQSRRDQGQDSEDEDDGEEFKDARSTPMPEDQSGADERDIPKLQGQVNGVEKTSDSASKDVLPKIDSKGDRKEDSSKQEVQPPTKEAPKSAEQDRPDAMAEDAKGTPNAHMRGKHSKDQKVSEWSHQQLAPSDAKEEEDEEAQWQEMPAYAPYDIYDDENRLVAREMAESDDGKDHYAGLGGAGRGYTRVQLDEDAQSATSMDDNTQYLFKNANGDTGAGEMEDEETRDALSQMQATKDLLTEGQKIAYVGMTRLILSTMLEDAEKQLSDKKMKKELRLSTEAMKMWSQKMMVRLYGHMDISTAEQVMIEQLAEHGVVPADLSPTLMQNARVKNPMAEKPSSTADVDSPRPSLSSRPSISSPKATHTPKEEPVASSPPPYQEHAGEDLPEVQIPSQLPTTEKLDIDLRWTVLCDLFLVLISDSIYDSRSRVLLEKVGQNMSIDWLEICRFEKKVTDALEMQQAAEKENWNEDEHKETRRKAALKKRYMFMGLATVGGGLVIGLSAGLLAPLIGAGLAAGFTTIGVAGTGGFLAGAGGAAIITSAAATSGGVIAVRAANRRTGAVKTFEYRPLHNNKRVNLIITVSGWMTGKVDDVRLPYSTVDPIMGDIYSVLWEPEMLRSMGDTINILATEALTQGLQQVLGSTILITLMAALQLPVVLTKLAYLIDNPWTVSLDRANMAGLILADSLIDRNLGTRPITFVGYSLGSRVIFSCLKELARKGAFGLVQNVYLFGSPIVAKRDEYLKARSVVAGRFVNGYATNDWILGYLFRLTSGGISRVAGLAPVEDVHGLENLNVTELVPGHMAYRTAMPRLLREAGWLVESDEFTEIEDPDPENHAQRQRELINEIEEARKEFEKEEKEKGKRKFSLFGRKKKGVEKKDWEMYQESKSTDEPGKSDDRLGENDHILFDIDAIRRELASEMIEVRELPSTLPPMKLDISSPTSQGTNPRDSLRETKSFDTAALPSNDFKPSGGAAVSSQRKDSYDIDLDIPPIRNLDANPRTREEESIEMTFDTAYKSPPSRSVTPSYSTMAPSPRSQIQFQAEDSWSSPAETGDRSATSQRPELKSSITAPVAAVGLGLGIGAGAGVGIGYASAQGQPISLEHNAWADEDEFDDGYGQEKEISMTFA